MCRALKTMGMLIQGREFEVEIDEQIIFDQLYEDENAIWKPSQAAEPERFYHGFVLGMVVELSDRYKVRSNRESGYGRYDVMIEPFDKAGKAFLFEFKVWDKECLIGKVPPFSLTEK